MEAEASIRGSHPRVVTGIVQSTILPSVLPAAPLQAPGGFHRFEPVVLGGITPARGNFLPDKEFRSVVPNRFRKGWTLS